MCSSKWPTWGQTVIVAKRSTLFSGQEREVNAWRLKVYKEVRGKESQSLGSTPEHDSFFKYG